MVNLITEHMDIWTAAQIQKANGGRGRWKNSNGQGPHGIKKLRELILELAVRGKLVPQDPNDEPASVLLKKIAKEKKRLIEEGKMKKQKPLPEIAEKEKKFEIPQGWEFVRLGEIANLVYGKNLPTTKLTATGFDVFGANGIIGKYTSYIYKESQVLISCRGAYSGKANMSPKKCYITNNSIVCELTKSSLNKNFLFLSLSAIDKSRIVSGSAQPQVTVANANPVIISVPPIAEQRRIVAKVDELMALCDQLEQQQTDSNDTHRTLVETLLATLTNAADQKEFAKAWQRIANYFDTILTTEQSIDQLEQTILQLAVMGKLPPQDPNDEPASVLLEKIAKEKARLIKEGKIKKQKPLPEIDDDEKPFDLPEGWEWARIGDASLFTEYGMSEKTFDGIDGIPVLKMGDIQDGKVILGGQKLVQENVEGLPSLFLKKWDLLYNRTNSAELVGKTGIYDGSDDAYTFASYLVRIRCSEKCVHPKYLNLSMNTSLFRATQIEPHLKQQCGQANVNATIMRNMIVPVPPIDEQHSIVAKVDELMALCDTLKARLNDATTTQVQLADAIVERAVA
ncbi:MAG: restriction endonuclease subunit S [Desulfobulbaceae bacterium]|nr:restriction endonuclease subunit S [Desulfobulbaceae bacterium]